MATTRRHVRDRLDLQLRDARRGRDAGRTSRHQPADATVDGLAGGERGVPLGWAWLFYSQHALWMASASLIIAAACTVPLVIAAWGSATWAGVVLLPYLAWLCIASSLAVGYAPRHA